MKGTAVAAQVLSGYTFTSSSGIDLTGTMTNNGAISKTITPSTSAQSYTVPKGYHDGTGKVTVNAANIAQNLNITVGFTGHNSNFSSTTPFKYTNNKYKYLKIVYSGYMPVKITGNSTTIYNKTSENNSNETKIVNISNYTTITCTGSHNGYTMCTLNLTFSMSQLS